MKKTRIILICSICLNLIFILAGIYVIDKKGGLSYLQYKVSNNQSSPFYRDKVSMYKILPKKLNTTIFLGDSITNHIDWYRLFDNVNIQNMGIDGDTTDGILNRLSYVTEEKPLKVFIMVGTNDLANGKSIGYVTNNYERIIKTIKNESPNTLIYIESVLPINRNIAKENNVKREDKQGDIKQLNTNLKKLSNILNINYIDLYNKLNENDQLNPIYTNDGLHINGSAYLIWKRTIEKYM